MATQQAQTPTVLFALEQVLGHVSLSQNIKRYAVDPTIRARFSDVTFHRERGVVERLPLPGYVRGGLRARLEVREALADGFPDAFFFNTQKPAVLCQDYLRQRPTLIGLDVTPVQYDAMGDEYGHRSDEAGPVRHLKHAVNRALFHRAVKLLPWSNWVARSLVDDYGVQPDRIRVIPPGADVLRWRPLGGERQGPVRIAFVGGNFERKGGRLLLQWFQQARTAGSCELHLVTRDAVPPANGVYVYRDMANNSDELIELVRRCDIFALPTLADCFSIASIEAAAAGLPVITSDVGGIADIVDDGNSGFLCRPGDAAGLARALDALVEHEDLRRRMGARARERVELLFDARVNVKAILSEIKAALECAAA